MTDKNYISPDKSIEFKKGKIHINNSEHVSAEFSKHKSAHHNAMHLNCPETGGYPRSGNHNAHHYSGNKLDEYAIMQRNPDIHENLANATHQGLTEMILSPDKHHKEEHLHRDYAPRSNYRHEEYHSRSPDRRKSSLKHKLPANVHMDSNYTSSQYHMNTRHS